MAKHKCFSLCPPAVPMIYVMAYVRDDRFDFSAYPVVALRMTLGEYGALEVEPLYLDNNCVTTGTVIDRSSRVERTGFVYGSWPTPNGLPSLGSDLARWLDAAKSELLGAK